LELTDAASRCTQFRRFRGRDTGPAAVVDIVLAAPVRERDRMDAEFDGGLLGLFTGTDERYSASTKLRRIGTGHDYEPSGSGHQLATETGTISVGQVNLSPVRSSRPGCQSVATCAARRSDRSHSHGRGKGR